MKFFDRENAYLGRSTGTPKAVRMVKVSPLRLAPPGLGSAAVLDGPENEACVLRTVAVQQPETKGTFLFEFVEDRGAWVGKYARAAKPWSAVTAEWLAAAWEVAAETLRRHLSGTAQPQDVRCAECGRVVPVPADAPGPVAEVLCGTEHVLTFGGEKAAVVAASGAVTWALVRGERRST